jgi:hypothetical protein
VSTRSAGPGGPGGVENDTRSMPTPSASLVKVTLVVGLPPMVTVTPGLTVVASDCTKFPNRVTTWPPCSGPFCGPEISVGVGL